MARRDDDSRELDSLPALDDGDQALIARVRALPTEGREPDWRQLESAIRAQVATLPSPVPWWRNWRFLVPIGALAATAAVALLVVGGHRADAPRAAATHVAPHDAATAETPSTEPPASAPSVWLDGEATELDETAALEALEELGKLDETDETDVLDETGEPAPAAALEALLVPDEQGAGEPSAIELEADEAGILPGTDYGWIDTLDDEAMGRAETWLARKRS